jgi:hypothetical protein
MGGEIGESEENSILVSRKDEINPTTPAIQQFVWSNRPARSRLRGISVHFPTIIGLRLHCLYMEMKLYHLFHDYEIASGL